MIEHACTFLDELKKGVPRVPYNKWSGYLDEGSLRGLGAKVIHWALSLRPTTFVNPAIDLNIAYRVSLELARYTLEPLKEDVWHALEQEKKALKQDLKKIHES